MRDCAAPSIPLFWLFRGYLKEEFEGHRDAAALCLFKNTGVKLVRRTDEGDGGRRESEAVEGKANRIASAAGSPYYRCKAFMQILCRCLSGPCSSKSGAL